MDQMVNEYIESVIRVIEVELMDLYNYNPDNNDGDRTWGMVPEAILIFREIILVRLYINE